MRKIKLNIEEDQFATLLACAFRNCVGQRDHITDHGVDWVTKLVPVLEDKYKEQILNAILNELETKDYEILDDEREMWEAVISYLYSGSQQGEQI